MSEENISITTVTDLQIAQALEGHDFNKSAAARFLGVTRKALVDRIDRTPDLKALMEDAHEEMIDDAEGIIRADLKAKDSSTARFVAQTQGKNRGWATTGVNKDGAIEVVVRGFADVPDNGGSNGGQG